MKDENIPEPGIPESFKVLIKEMQALCLNVRVMNEAARRSRSAELDEDAFRTTESLGIDLSRPNGHRREDAARKPPVLDDSRTSQELVAGTRHER